LNYWNALAALIAFGLPLLLALASSARSLIAQAAAAAAIPLVVLCGYLTLSRGGAIAAAVGLTVYFALAPERVAKLLGALAPATGSAALIAGSVHRSAIEHGLTNSAARQQGDSLLVAVILVCAGVALAQVAVGLAVRHGTPPRWLTLTRSRARWLLAGTAVVCVAVALVAGAPARLSHAWTDFKNPSSAALRDNSIGRFASASGNGRYDYWKAGVDATSGHVLAGSGAGTYQLLWLPRAPYYSYVQNAHSLYVETLAELGVVGLVLLAGFFAVVIGVAVRLVARTRYEARTRAAAVAAALIAFCVSAGSEWTWQVPALPTACLLLAAAVLAPGIRDVARVGRSQRIATIAAAIACLIAIAVPLATTSALRVSQAAASSGDPARALAAARAAARVEPGAASPQLQLALVLELQRNIPQALAATHRATRDEPTNWSTWLIASRLEAEAGHPAASLAAFRRARSLNPRSTLFGK
jgi:O-antigen ligase